MYGYSREAIKVKVKKCEGNLPPEWRKFSVDPQITSLEVLYSILAKAFDLKTDFGISYRISDSQGQELYLPVVSDYDLDAAFLRAHNQSITSKSSEPCLNLRVDIKPFSEATEWDISSVQTSRETSPLQQLGAGQRYVQTVQNRLPGLIMNQMEKTLSMVQRALNLVEDPSISQPPRTPLSDTEFRGFLDSVGQIVHTKELRRVIYIGGIEPSLRRVVWKHILNVYPEGMTGRERMDYMKRKSTEYAKLRDSWKTAVQNGAVVGELAYVTSMVRKDVLRTDRLHPFYAGSDDNQNIAALFNILTTYALNHPAVSYCQGMSDIASPLLVTMSDEAQAYICFCAVMTRLRTNFMLDGIAMTQKFSHLSEALQHYDPEFYDYLKSQQADDLLFCYRWLLLEMKREFAFDDSLRMLEVLWSSLPSEPPIKELPLFEKEFIPQTIDMPPPKSPSVILRTPRENPYTKICALRRQSSALSLYSSGTPTNSVYNSQQHQYQQQHKLNKTKRMNQSLDENIIRNNKTKNIIKSHQSLDETKLLLLTEEIQQQIQQNINNQIINNFDNVKEDDKKIIINESKEDNTENINNDNKEGAVLLDEAASLFLFDKVDNFIDDKKTITITPINARSVSPTIELNHHNNKRDGNYKNDGSGCGGGSSGGQGNNRHSRNRNINQLNQKAPGNLITKQLNNKKSGHFKDLKDRIAASKKGIFTSLDKIETFHGELNDEHNKKQTKGQKVVKNFNEFLNFASINKSRISDRLTNNKKLLSLNNIDDDKTSKPLIKLTKSSFDDSDSSSLIDSNERVDSNNKPLQLQLNNIIIEKQISFDGSSPDDSQEYFPMTTSMTRELRLELENLDRQVFGSDFHNRQQFNIMSGCDTPESGDSILSTEKSPAKYSEIIYTKLNQNSIDILEIDNDEQLTEICSCPINEKNINGVRNRIRSNDYDDNTFKRISTSSINNDVFIWENPLHLNSNSNIDIDNEKSVITTTTLNQQQQIVNQTTPDEQSELDYDGEIIEETVQGKKSVTPIRLLRKNGDYNSSNNKSNRNSTILINNSDSDNSDSWNETKNLTIKNDNKLIINELLVNLPYQSGTILGNITNSCEEASETNNIIIDMNKMVATGLPQPKEFGGGNPFLMFLCLTILLQHRDYVIKNCMDYNEMAMHFDKMVRKHNVIKTLNQARRMYADYLKSQTNKNSTTTVLSPTSGDVKT